MRRILHVITGLGVGGAENALLRLVSELDRERFHNTVLTLRDGPLRARFTASGIDVIDARLQGIGGLPRAWHAIGAAARSVRPDLVQGWMNHGNLAAWRVRRVVGSQSRLVWGIRQSLYDIRLEKPATRWVIRAEAALSHAPDMILFNSSLAVDQHRAQGFRNPRMEVIPNGFDTENFCADVVARRDIRTQLGIPDDAILVGLVARLHPVKDFPMFFRAMASALQSDPRLWVLAVGKDVPSALPDVERIIGRRCASRVVLRDESAEIARVYAAMDLLCSTSYAEGFPNVVAEAMACEVPCVVTDAGDAATMVSDTGIVIARRDADACASGVLRLANLGNAERAELGRRARQRVIDEYSIDGVARRYAKIYESLLERNESP